MAGGAAAVAEWFVHSYSLPVCQLLLDHSSASIVPGSVVLSKLRGDRSCGKKRKKNIPKARLVPLPLRPALFPHEGKNKYGLSLIA